MMISKLNLFIGLLAFSITVLALLILSQYSDSDSGGGFITISRFPVPLSTGADEVEDLKEPENFVEFLKEYLKFNKGRKAPPMMDKWFEYAKEQQCSLHPMGAYSRLYKDLDRFRDFHKQQVRNGKRKAGDPVISPDQVTRALQMDRIDILRVRADGDLSQSTGGAGAVVDAIRPFAKYLGDLDLVMNGLDEPRVLKRQVRDKTGMSGVSFNADRSVFNVNENSDIIPLMRQVCDSEVVTDDNAYFNKHGFFLGPCSFDATDALVPVFSSASISACFSDIMIPNVYYLTSASDAAWKVPLPSQPIDSSIDQQGLWQNKQAIVQWRGSNTGGGSNDGRKYMKFQRNRLVSLAETVHVENVEINIGFTSIIQCSGNACSELTAKYPLKNSVDHSESRKYKYLIDIDGNSFSQRFLPFLRFTQSLILKINLFEDWITEQLKPMRHYLPIDLSLKDFREKIEWARDHDDEAKRIAQRAQIYASERLRYQDMQCYLFRLLLEYEQLLNPTSTFL